MGNGQASFGKWLLLSGIIPLLFFLIFGFSPFLINLDAKLTQHFFVCPAFSPILYIRTKGGICCQYHVIPKFHIGRAIVR